MFNRVIPNSKSSNAKVTASINTHNLGYIVVVRRDNRIIAERVCQQFQTAVDFFASYCEAENQKVTA